MEQEKMKRAREGDCETHRENSQNAKKRDVCGTKLMKDMEKDKEKWESELGFGVFDFPWLKDGVMSKSEDYLVDFEDNFWTLLQQEDSFLKAATVDFSKAYGLCETPEACMSPIPEPKLEDLTWKPFEAEDVDCIIWSSFLNQPI